MLRVTSPPGAAAKRLLDIVGASVGLVLLVPIAAVLGVAIKLDSRGPVLFRQLRVGRRGKPFAMWKFRTMSDGAEAVGPGITTSMDGRITRVGRVLRRCKADELPQLFNVLIGDMSLVGPRPELPTYTAAYSATERSVLEGRPGITDPASLAFRNEEAMLAQADDPDAYYRSTLIRQKIDINLQYRERATVFSDILIILQTMRAVLR